MNVKVLGVTEQNQLSPQGTLQKVLVVRYMVGSLGPFSLITNQAELGSGAALQKMNAFAQQLGTLPVNQPGT